MSEDSAKSAIQYHPAAENCGKAEPDKTNVSAPADNEPHMAAGKNHDRSKKDEKHWLDHTAVALALFALITSCFAAWFTHEQVRIAEDTEIRQLRAYVYVKAPHGGLTGIAPGEARRAVMAIRNSGQTPAYHVRIRGNIGFGPYPLPNGQAFTEGLYGGNIVINPETETSTGGVIGESEPISKEDIDSISNGDIRRIYLFGDITYVDAFGVKRFSEYCFSYFGTGPILTQSDICDQHTEQN